MWWWWSHYSPLHLEPQVSHEKAHDLSAGRLQSIAPHRKSRSSRRREKSNSLDVDFSFPSAADRNDSPPGAFAKCCTDVKERFSVIICFLPSLPGFFDLSLIRFRLFSRISLFRATFRTRAFCFPNFLLSHEIFEHPQFFVPWLCSDSWQTWGRKSALLGPLFVPLGE